MDTFTITSQLSSGDTYRTNEYCTSLNKSESADDNLNKTNTQITNASSISDDAVLGYNFYKMLQASIDANDKNSSVNKYIEEYRKIKKEIASGTYGDDKERYKNLLNNAFKNVISGISDSVIKQSNQPPKIKFSASELINAQREHDSATTLVWIFKAENKRILKEIEYYKRKKNHRLVNSLRQLSSSYKHAIDNLSTSAASIKNNIDDTFNEDKSVDREKLAELDNK